MNPAVRTNLASLRPDDIAKLRRNWYWFVILGVAILIFGFVGLALVGLLSVVTTVLVGWFLLISGAAEVIHAIIRRGWNGFVFDLFAGLLSVVVGLMLVVKPLEGTVTLTTVIGILLLGGGVVRMIFAFFAPSAYGTWIFLFGLLGVLLGGMILTGLPYSAEWVIGTFVAVDMIMNGARLIALGLGVKSLPTESPPPTA